MNEKPGFRNIYRRITARFVHSRRTKGMIEWQLKTGKGGEEGKREDGVIPRHGENENMEIAEVGLHPAMDA